MKRLFAKPLAAFLALAFLAFWSCEKDSGLIGLDTLGETRADVGVLLQYPVLSFTLADDSVLSTNPQRALVGSYVDQRIGKHQASFAAHLLLQSSQPNFGSNPIVDSVRLALRYAGYYGDTNKPMTIKAFRLDEYLDPDKNDYYSSRTWKKGELLGEVSPTGFKPNTGLSQGDEVLTPRLYIPIDPSLIQSLIVDASATRPEDFKDNNAFIKYFNGIVVESTGDDGSILYFDAQTGVSRMQIYFRNDTDTGLFELRTDNSGRLVNSFSHDFSAAPFDPTQPDTVLGEEFTYVQAMGGAITGIEFPTLGNLVDSAYLINRVELKFRVDFGSDANGFAAPQQLLLLETAANDTGKVLIKDYSLNSGVVVGGTLIKGQYKEKQYTFNITRHIFDRLKNQGKGTRLFLVSGAGASTANRVVLNGNLHGRNPLTLDIYYTRKP